MGHSKESFFKCNIRRRLVNLTDRETSITRHCRQRNIYYTSLPTAILIIIFFACETTIRFFLPEKSVFFSNSA